MLCFEAKTLERIFKKSRKSVLPKNNKVIQDYGRLTSSNIVLQFKVRHYSTISHSLVSLKCCLRSESSTSPSSIICKISDQFCIFVMSPIYPQAGWVYGKLHFKNWSRWLACSTRVGSCKGSWPLLTMTFLSSPFRSLLITHFGCSQKADFWYATLF